VCHEVTSFRAAKGSTTIIYGGAREFNRPGNAPGTFEPFLMLDACASSPFPPSHSSFDAASFGHAGAVDRTARAHPGSLGLLGSDRALIVMSGVLTL
jgi:hypothetical protein